MALLSLLITIPWPLSFISCAFFFFFKTPDRGRATFHLLPLSKSCRNVRNKTFPHFKLQICQKNIWHCDTRCNSHASASLRAKLDMPKEQKWKGVNQTSNNCWVLVICYSTFSQANSLQSLKDTRGKTGAREDFSDREPRFSRGSFATSTLKI